MRLVVWRSMYSLISSRTNAWSSSKSCAARARASSVFPTPVGPRNSRDPSGRLGSCRPARARRIDVETARTAESWPMTRACRRSSRCSSFSASPSISLVSGTPVHNATTSAMSCSSTSFFAMRSVAVAFSCATANWSSADRKSPYLMRAARSRSIVRVALSSSVRSASTDRLRSPIVSSSWSSCSQQVWRVLCCSRDSANSDWSTSSRAREAGSRSFRRPSRSISS